MHIVNADLARAHYEERFAALQAERRHRALLKAAALSQKAELAALRARLAVARVL